MHPLSAVATCRETEVHVSLTISQEMLLWPGAEVFDVLLRYHKSSSSEKGSKVRGSRGGGSLGNREGTFPQSLWKKCLARIAPISRWSKDRTPSLCCHLG